MLLLTWKGLLAHKLRFALTALAVMLGVSFLSGTNVLTDTITRTFDDLFADVNQGTDAFVRSRSKIESQLGTQRERIPASLLPGIREIEGVREADGYLQFYAQMADRAGEPIGNPGHGSPTFGSNWTPQGPLSPWNLVRYRGRASRSPRASGQVVVDKASADTGKLRIGQTVTVLTQAAPKEYTIVGVAKFGNVDSPAGASFVMFTTGEAQQVVSAPGEYDAISVAADRGISQEEMVRRVRAEIGDAKQYQVLTGAQITAESQDAIQRGLNFFKIGLTIFAYVALFVSIFIIFNTFSIVVAQRLRELALLRAIGASGRQVLWSVLGEALVVGVLASAAGLALGVLLASGLKALLAGFGIDVPAGGVVVTARTAVLALAVGTVITVISAVLPARKAARVPPVAALRDVAVERIGRRAGWTIAGVVLTTLGVASLLFGLFGASSNGLPFVGLGALVVFVGVAVLGPTLARPVGLMLGWPLARVRGITGELARENSVRNPRRTAVTAAALMIGVALVGFITIFAASTKQSISVAIDRAFRADYVISPMGDNFGTGLSPDLAKQVATLPQIEAVSGLRFGAFEVDGSGKFLAASDPAALNALFDVDPVAGNFARLGPDEIAVSRKVADDKGWKVGSEVPTKFPVGGTGQMTVGAIYGIGQQEGLSDYFMSLDSFDARYTESLDNQVYARLRPGVTPAEGKRALEPVLKDYPTAELQDQAEYKQAQEAQINTFVNLIYALLGLAVIIAVIGIANTLALSIYERTHELGLLRAVGMTRRQLRSTVRWEAVIIALFGTGLGLVIGLFFGWAIVEALKEEGITEFAPPGLQLLVVVVLAALFGVVAAIFPARRASRLDVLRAVATE